MKGKHVISILILNYLLIIIVSAIAELWFVSNKAKEVQLLMQTAADMALEQSQVSDDFFVRGNTYLASGNAFKLKMPAANGNGFVDVDMFKGIYNIDTTNSENKELAFKKLYNNDEFRTLASKTGNIRTYLKYDIMSWYSVPRVVYVGVNLLSGDFLRKSGTAMRTRGGSVVSESTAKGVLNLYGLSDYRKESMTTDYYFTPISVGITYLNSEFLNTLYMNNMDLLMRAKYTKQGINLNSVEGGNGVLKGNTYADKVASLNSSLNPINNGSFTLIRGTAKNDRSPDVQAYVGTLPTIEYKVIDMYDSAYDSILVELFGANKGSYGTKAEYLKSLDSNQINPMSGGSYKSKLIVIAKVTFYADVIIPYSTLPLREFRGNLDSSANNFLDIKHTGTTGKSGAVGNDMLTYTRYFAVAP